MDRYVALLRGVNISGKNRVPMPELRQYCEELGFSDTVTFLNSGNIVFSSEEKREEELAGTVRNMIAERFGLDVPVFVIRQADLIKILDAAPQWWGTEDKSIYDNLIFVMPPSGSAHICEAIGAPSEGLEQIEVYDERTIFWSFDRKRYAKANWWKQTASDGIAGSLTIRTANTVRKAAEL